jgi:hypothetical protein
MLVYAVFVVIAAISGAGILSEIKLIDTIDRIRFDVRERRVALLSADGHHEKVMQLALHELGNRTEEFKQFAALSRSYAETRILEHAGILLLLAVLLCASGKSA